MLPIKQMLLSNHNRPRKKIIKLKGIVMHWTANTGKGANAQANRNYFNRTSTAASAHYIVDDSQIIQCVPDDEIAYHVGAKKYTSIGESIRKSPYSPNYYLIGIEMCVNSDGDWNKTYKNSVDLAAFLLNKYKLDVNSLYRHYDITGKDCPRMMVSDLAWNKFKTAVNTKLKELKNPPKTTQPIMQGKVIPPALNCYPIPSALGKDNGKIQQGKILNIYKTQGDWYLVNSINPQWVKKQFIKII